MANKKVRKRRLVLALIAAAAVSLVVALGLLVLVPLIRMPDRPAPSPQQSRPNAQPPTVPTGPRKPRPEFQDASCPDVMLVSVPGTWESAPQDDPLNPTANPNSLLLTVTRPLAEQINPERVEAYTVPYRAQFHNPFANDNQITYDQSRKEGTDATRAAMVSMNTKCPLTTYALVGFSQGAVIAGDIAADIGSGRGPVDEDLVLGVTLIADGRRQSGVGQDVPPTPPGQGAEVTLHEMFFQLLKGLGLTMTGARPGGFGAMNDRTFEICAEGDLICSAPREAFDITKLPRTVDVLLGGAGEPIHALYGTPQFWNFNGQPATVWARDKLADLIENAPHPKHG